jgi:glycosyltransferase involved in cell wall biosynthesis
MKPLAVFYCPAKRANENVASGLPRVASLMAAALRHAGYEVATPDLPMTYDGHGDPGAQRRLRQIAIRCAQRLAQKMDAEGTKPALWFTYHSYYKSPDMIGPVIREASGCRYVLAEASFAAKRSTGPWAEHHASAHRALQCADLVLAATERDRPGLERAVREAERVRDFPPFIDCAPYVRERANSKSGPTKILAAGSMRDERKIQSYRRLFSSLGALNASTFTLSVAGGGPRRLEVESIARSFGLNVRFHGQLAPSAMPEFLASGDIFAWPGIGEAYGLTYLEAQASGLPVVAVRQAGVDACVLHGVSGILSDPAGPETYQAALIQLIDNSELRNRLSESARNWIAAERSLPVAAVRLREYLEQVRA